MGLQDMTHPYITLRHFLACQTDSQAPLERVKCAQALPQLRSRPHWLQPAGKAIVLQVVAAHTCVWRTSSDRFCFSQLDFRNQLIGKCGPSLGLQLIPSPSIMQRNFDFHDPYRKQARGHTCTCAAIARGISHRCNWLFLYQNVMVFGTRHCGALHN